MLLVTNSVAFAVFLQCCFWNHLSLHVMLFVIKKRTSKVVIHKTVLSQILNIVFVK